MPSPPLPATRAPRATLAHAGQAAELRIALVKAVRRMRLERSDDGITDTQWSVLAHLERSGPRTARELADAEHVQPPSMTRTVNALEERGLVARTEHPQDRRAVLVAVTQAGAAAVRETRRRRDAWLARRLAALEPGEREVLHQAALVLRRLVEEPPR